MNVFVCTGRLGKDAEQRAIPSGTMVAQFPVAVDSGYGDKKKTTWFRCSLWGKRAEGGLVPYLKKGQEVGVSGELTMNEYESNGEKKYSLELKVSEIDLIGGKPSADPTQHETQKANAYQSEDDGGGDIPW